MASSQGVTSRDSDDSEKESKEDDEESTSSAKKLREEMLVELEALENKLLL